MKGHLDYSYVEEMLLVVLVFDEEMMAMVMMTMMEKEDDHILGRRLKVKDVEGLYNCRQFF